MKNKIEKILDVYSHECLIRVGSMSPEEFARLDRETSIKLFSLISKSILPVLEMCKAGLYDGGFDNTDNCVKRVKKEIEKWGGGY